MRIAESGTTDNYDGTLTVTATPGVGELKASYWQDALGRNYRQIDWLYNGDTSAAAAYDRTTDHDGQGNVSRELVTSRQGPSTGSGQADTIVSETFNEYQGALGAVTGSTAHTWKNNVFQATSRTDTSYAWWDGAVVSSVAHRPNTAQTPVFTTSYYYDGSGQLTSAYVGDGRPRSITWTNDMNGQAMRRDEADHLSGGDPHEVWYRYAGREMGYTGNNGTADTDYQSSVAARTRAAPTTTTGAFRGGATYGAAHTDVDQSLESINSYEQGGSGGAYTVRAGDTLSGIAANLWGDAALWYKLAEVNGLSQQSALSEGQRLTIPDLSLFARAPSDGQASKEPLELHRTGEERLLGQFRSHDRP